MAPTKFFSRAIAFAILTAGVSAFAQGSPNLVISQVYGGGGNSGATWRNDYIELFNRGTDPVSLSGLSLQYTSATGTGNFGANANQLTVLPNVTLSPGQYYLVQEAANGTSTVGALLTPAPDLVPATPINMSASDGKVALVNSTASLGCNGGSNPCSTAAKALIIDLVGYGSANFFEGGKAAPSISSTFADFRRNGGRTDSDDNGADFVKAAPVPRNSGETASAIGVVLSVDPASPAWLGDTVVFSAVVTPALNPTSTGIAVAADLSAIGGGAAVAFTDNGDGSFSASFTIATDGPTGTFSLPVSVSDAQGRSATSSIALSVFEQGPKLAIHDIQGPGVWSPWVDSFVQTTGIVTAVKSRGFFLQARDSDADADPNTSEGVFVFTNSAPPPAAAVGNELRVRGRVQDFIPASDPYSPPVTELGGSVAVALLGTGNALPVPVEIASIDPAGDVSQLAKYEGMRVHVGSVTVVGPTRGSISETSATSTSLGIFYAVLTGTPRPFREPGVEAPAPVKDDIPRFDGNPERLGVDTLGCGATALEVASGAVVDGLTGALDFASRTFTVCTDPGTSPAVSNNDAHAIPVRPGIGEGEITVASFNMERFYDTVNDPESDAVLSVAGFDRRLAKASLVIRDVLNMPDIIGVEEMEHLSTLQAVAERIEADGGPHYDAYLVEGNDIGGIDVGILVKPSRIDVASVEQVGKDTMFLQPDQTLALLNDRPPLVMKAAVVTQGKELPYSFTFIVNHLRSLSGIDDAVDGARVRAKRLAQAEDLANLIEQHQSAGELVISVGDYNAFDVNDGYVDVINTVRGGPPHPTEDFTPEFGQLVSVPLIDLAPADPAQHYSYTFSGNAQVLDHIIVSQGLTVNEFTYARNDADFPESLRGDATRPERISDHDMPVAYFAVPRDTTPPTVTVTGVAQGGTYLLGSITPGCSTTDDASGVQTPATLVVTGSVGAVTATCTGAVDNVGNAAADVSVSYRIWVYTFGGFGPPLASGPTVKGGSTVPVKFRLYDLNGNLVSDRSVISAVEYEACSGGSWQPAAATGGTALRFDPTDGQFVFNWATPAPGCWTIGVRTADTLRHTATVTVR